MKFKAIIIEHNSSNLNYNCNKRSKLILFKWLILVFIYYKLLYANYIGYNKNIKINKAVILIYI